MYTHISTLPVCAATHCYIFSLGSTVSTKTVATRYDVSTSSFQLLLHWLLYTLISAHSSSHLLATPRILRAQASQHISMFIRTSFSCFKHVLHNCTVVVR